MSETKYISATLFVSKMVRKYSTSRTWIWVLLEEQFNIIKGLGCVLTGDEAQTIEDIIVELLNE